MADDAIQEIRKARHDISKECGHDVREVLAYYRAVQDELKRSGQFQFEERSTISQSREQTMK